MTVSIIPNKCSPGTNRIIWRTDDSDLRVIWWPWERRWYLETRWSGTVIYGSQASQIIKLMKKENNV